jgi:hypothetical protein
MTGFSITNYAVRDHLAALSGAFLLGSSDTPRLGVSLSTAIAKAAIDVLSIIKCGRYRNGQCDNCGHKNQDQLPHHHLRWVLAQAPAIETRPQLNIL